jgi:magnesium transporter
MISIYKTTYDNTSKLEKLDSIESGCWINVVSPTTQDLSLLSKKTSVPIEFLRAPLDDEEASRIEIEDDITLVVIDIPFTEMEDNSLTYDTYPLAIIYTKNELITICLKNSKIITDFINGKVRNFYTFKRSRFILQILYRVSSYYLVCLRQIDKKSLMIQKKLQKSMGNRELMHLLSLRNSLIYFSTSLKSNEISLEKMLKLDLLQKYEEDKDLLEDVIIENTQAIEMTNIYSNILTGTMDASASVISNNLNLVMKLMTAVTIVMSIPTMISGYWGMNFDKIPLSHNPFGFWYAIGISILLCLTATVYLMKKKMF